MNQTTSSFCTIELWWCIRRQAWYTWWCCCYTGWPGADFKSVFFPNSFSSLPAGTKGSLTLDQIDHWQPDSIFCKIYIFSWWTFFSFISCPFSFPIVPFSMQINWKGCMPNSTLDRRVTSPKKRIAGPICFLTLKFTSWTSLHIYGILPAC